jgi:hypothetical protein
MRLIKMLLCFISLIFPVSAQEGASPHPPDLLIVSGNIGRTNGGREFRFDRAALEALGVVTMKTSTQFTDGQKTFEGVLLRDVLAHVGAGGKQITAQALNGYETVIPLSDLEFGPILALRMDGIPLTARDKGPLWIVYPRDQFPDRLSGAEQDQKWIWQLRKLDVE